MLDPVVEERIRKAMNFEEPDRVPIWDYIDNRAALEHFAPGETDLLKANISVYHGLGIDFCRGYGASYDLAQEGEVYEAGDTHRKISGLTNWVTQYPIRTLEDLSKAEFPIPSREWVYDEWIPWNRKIQEAFEPHTLYVPGSGCGFHAAYGLMGLQLFSYAIYDARQDINRLLEARMKEAVLFAEAAAEAKLGPLYFVGDDIAYKGALMFSPEFLRETFIPMLRVVCKPLKETGIKVIYHSDGYVMEILDDMIAAGIDGLNPIEPLAGMDIGFLKQRYGRKLILVGNVDCSQVLPLGTRAEVIEATKACLRAAAPGGGHFIGSSSEITPSTPLENILTFYQAVREYGRYPIRC